METDTEAETDKMSREHNGNLVLVSVSVQYEHFCAILFKPFLSVSVSGNRGFPKLNLSRIELIEVIEQI